VTCHNCRIACKRHGRDRKGNQRFKCRQCSKTFLEPQDKPLDGMYLPMSEAELILKMLVEGSSVSTVERITGVHHTTILKLLALAGERCERLMEDRIKALPVVDVQADEIWSFIQKKEKTKGPEEAHADEIGDNWTFVAIEWNSKLIVAWHTGRRTKRDTLEFTEKLADATTGRFQLTTDGFGPYRAAVAESVGQRVDFAQLVKVYATTREGSQRYSPAEVVEAVPYVRIGTPDPEKICTSHIERQNLTMRMGMRRFTRLTNGFSKTFKNHRAAIALHFAFYNFCRVHRTLRATPAMAAGITNRAWGISDLLA
jgi:transposase-like protein/IS1 family transposase